MIFFSPKVDFLRFQAVCPGRRPVFRELGAFDFGHVTSHESLTLKITARESKTREIWQSDGAQIFFGSCYDVSHQKKTWNTKIPSFGGGQILVQVAYSSIKNSKIRFEFRRLLDRLGVYERCQITQRERETISLRPAAPPRVNLV